MAASEGDVSRTRGFNGLNPLAGIEAHRIEARRGLGILVGIEITCVQVPLALSKLAIDAPVQKNAETEALELPPCGQILGRGNILCRCHDRHQHQ